jgi:hypothetical protein
MTYTSAKEFVTIEESNSRLGARLRSLIFNVNYRYLLSDIIRW